jgi:hypothetical protein
MRPPARRGPQRAQAQPAPTAIRPIGKAALPTRDKAPTSRSGSARPLRLKASPATVAWISGLRSSSRPRPWPPWRASGHTAATLTSGTHSATSSAIQARPWAPAMRSDSASAM